MAHKKSSQIALRSLLAGALLGIVSFLILVPSTFTSGAPPRQLTPTGITAEPIGEANVRTAPTIESEMIGSITNGTRYVVYGQNEFVPWLLIEYPGAPEGVAWVFADLMTTSIPRAQIPYISDSVVVSTPSPSPTIQIQATEPEQTDAPAHPTATALPPTAVTIQARDTINVRFGPGVDYPRIGQIRPGETYVVNSRHSLFPWLRIDLNDAPDGVGWVFMDVVDVQGNIYDLPVIIDEEIGWPTLTPTPPFVVTVNPPWTAEDSASTSTSAAEIATAATAAPDIQALGVQVLDYVLGQGFVPEEERFASVFMVNLSTGENFSFGRGIAYSGMSLIKIPILVEYYRRHTRPLDALEAETVANTMICSGNHTANDMLATIGDGDPYIGAERVTATMHQLGLEDTFITAPFVIGDEPVDPGRPVPTVSVPADQERAEPDPFNQTTPEDLGWLLNGIYQCAVNESGPLIDELQGEMTATKCRQIILAMSANQINVLSEAGVPTGTRVAHKHGWVDDTHGDAAIVFTPGSDFVLTMAFHEPEWLPYEESWPVMAEVTRRIYNTLNPDEPLDAIHPATVDETCELQGNPLLGQLTASNVPPIQ